MRFMSMVKSSENYRLGPPPQALMDAINELGQEMTKTGTMVDMGGLLPTAMGAYRVRQSRGKLSVTDGPFVESKEVIGGFAILEASSKEEAIRLAKEFLKVAGDGECELRQIFTASDGTGDCSDVHAQLAEQFTAR